MVVPGRQKYVSFRVRPKESADIRKAALAEEVTVSEFARERLVTAAREVLGRRPETKESGA